MAFARNPEQGDRDHLLSADRPCGLNHVRIFQRQSQLVLALACFLHLGVTATVIEVIVIGAGLNWLRTHSFPGLDNFPTFTAEHHVSPM